jgi:multicomponent Na+:H+ antiporter subunit F
MSAGVLAVVSGPMDVGLLMLAVALLMAFVRLVLGPTLPDRVIALDLIAVLVVGVVVSVSIRSGQAVYVEGAVVLGLVAFLGTVAFARYLERREHGE